jgi:hypothetical protein
MQLLPLRGLHQRRLGRKRKRRHGLRNMHAYTMQDLPQLARSLDTAVATVADNHGGFPMPFMEKIVNGILDDGRIAPVVLRQDEDERSVFLDLFAPGAGMGLGVVGAIGDLRGDGRLVEHGEVPGGQVDEVQFG